eukprot:TRINITY_DN43057_c0_g1_i1.p1 TRINITY_DN43057_c0_g1~~TRINITY_DN43057_c0_g1_i1.p1  ORF type:complete len:550 (+),score=49.16 TRINITY_DN43057_c0_g1_i1:83-1651(+)
MRLGLTTIVLLAHRWSFGCCHDSHLSQLRSACGQPKCGATNRSEPDASIPALVSTADTALKQTASWIQSTLGAKESVTAAEGQLWTCIGLKNGHLCQRFGYEENPYYIMILSSVASYFAMLLFGVGRARCRTAYKNFMQLPDEEEPDVPAILSRAKELEKREVLVEEYRQIEEVRTRWKHKESSSPPTQVSMSATREDAECVAKYRGDAVEVCGQIQDAVEYDTRRLATLNAGWFVSTLLSYWTLQLAMSISVWIGLSRSVLVSSPAEELSWWAQYNLYVYALANSSAFMTGSQAVAKSLKAGLIYVCSQIAKSLQTCCDCCDKFLNCLSWCSSLLGSGRNTKHPSLYAKLPELTDLASDMSGRASELKMLHERVVKYEQDQKDGKSHVVSIAFLVLILPSIVTHTIPFLVVYVAPAALVCYVISVITSSIAQNHVTRACECLRSESFGRFLVDDGEMMLMIAVVLVLQTSVSVMTRVYSGQWHEGYLHPVINDFQARTLKSIMVCYMAKGSNYLDLVTRWT